MPRLQNIQSLPQFPLFRKINEHLELAELKQRVDYYQWGVNENTGGDSVIQVAANGFNAIGMTNDSQHWLLIYDLAMEATSTDFLIEISDHQNHNFQNQAIHATTFMGNGLRPFTLREPIIVPPENNWSCEFTDRSGGTNNIRLLYAGKRVDFDYGPFYDMLNKATKSIHYYMYTFDTTVQLPASTTIETIGSFRIHKNFLATHIHAYGSVATGFLYRIKNVTASKEYSTAWMHSLAGLGNGQYSRQCHDGWLLPAGTLLKTTMRNTSGVATQDVWLTLIGYHLD